MMRYPVIFLFGLFLMSCDENQAQQEMPVIENVDAKRFSELFSTGEGIILDVRTPEEVAQGQIPNASTINIYDPDFEEKVKLMDKSKAIYVYCKSGGRSSQAAEILSNNGFARVYNLQGGIMGWEAAGYELTVPGNKPDDNIRQLSLSEFQTFLKTEGPVLVDFHTVWCVPCKKMAPVVDKLEKEFEGKAKVMRVDMDSSREVGKEYQITGVPVFIIFKDGEVKWRHTGIIAEDMLREKLQEFI